MLLLLAWLIYYAAAIYAARHFDVCCLRCLRYAAARLRALR